MMEKAVELRKELATVKPRLDTERYKFLLESYRETEGEPTIIRRARLFEKILKNKTIYIDENPAVSKRVRMLWRGGQDMVGLAL